MSLVVVARFSTLGEAQAARSAVDAADVFVRMADENVVAIEWLYSNAVGGVKLLVREEDREQVEELLTREAVEPSDDLLADPSVASSGSDAFGDETDDESAAMRCPSCGSADVVEIPKLTIFAVLSVVMAGVGAAVNEPGAALVGMVIAGLILAFTNGNRCKACGENWRGATAPEPIPEAPFPASTDTAGLRCPRCGTAELHYVRYRRLKSIPLLFALTFIVVVPIWLLLPKKRCDHCNLRLWL